jgi:hypothetical protein
MLQQACMLRISSIVTPRMEDMRAMMMSDDTAATK